MQLLDYEIKDTCYNVWITTDKKFLDNVKKSNNVHASLLLVDCLPKPLPNPVEKTLYSSEFSVEEILPEKVLAEVRLLGILKPTIRVGREELKLWT